VLKYWALQSVENGVREVDLYQGTNLFVPQSFQNQLGFLAPTLLGVEHCGNFKMTHY